jgi:hypothetical protein
MKSERVPRFNWLDKLPDRDIYDDEAWTRKWERNEGIPYSAEKINELGGFIVDMKVHFIGENLYEDAVSYLAAMHKIDKRRYHHRGFSKKKTINYPNRRYERDVINHLFQRIEVVDSRKGTGFIPSIYSRSHFVLKRRFELNRGKLWELQELIHIQKYNLPMPQYGIDESMRDPFDGYFIKLRAMIARRNHNRGFYNSQTMRKRLAEASKLNRELSHFRNKESITE